jgi:glycine/D-amino acid oxidase-like deaminating enzyme
MSTDVFDVLIVGAGAVGVAVAREMTLLGKRCVVCEKNVDVLDEASSGNTGVDVLKLFFFVTEKLLKHKPRICAQSG